jgi:uncharacterized protein YqcC (DUF446 family)
MSKSEQVQQKLQEIEAELRRIGFWDDSLDEEVVRTQALQYAKTHGKSPVGAMPFENWLQAVLIPNARDAATRNELPSESQVWDMARREYDYHSHVPEAQRLLELLREFDAIFKSRATIKPDAQPSNPSNDRKVSKPWWKFW